MEDNKTNYNTETGQEPETKVTSEMEKIERNNIRIVAIAIIALVILFIAAYLGLHAIYNQAATGTNTIPTLANNNSANINNVNTISKNSSTNTSAATSNTRGNTITASNTVVIKGNSNKSVVPPPVP